MKSTMKTRLVSAVSAAALSVALFGAAAAQEDLGLKQLQDTASSTLAQLNVDTTLVPALTLDELAQIQAITSSSGPDQTKVGRIETILRAADERIAAGGAVAPTGAVGDVSTDDLAGDRVVAANVGAYIARLGLADQIDVDALSTDQLLQVQLISESSEGDTQQRARVEQLLLN